jgi:hypothetical protein
MEKELDDACQHAWGEHISMIDAESQAELSRLRAQDRLLTVQPGELLPEQPGFAHCPAGL